MVALDPVGNVSLILQIAVLFLLVLGVLLIKGVNTKKNIMRHGYLTVAALVLHSVLIFVVMVPSFDNGLGELGGLSGLESLDIWSHVVLGTAAEVMAIFIVVPWLAKGPSLMTCARMKRWMMPTFIIWVIAIVNGTLIHVLGML